MATGTSDLLESNTSSLRESVSCSILHPYHLAKYLACRRAQGILTVQYIKKRYIPGAAWPASKDLASQRRKRLPWVGEWGLHFPFLRIDVPDESILWNNFWNVSLICFYSHS